MTRGTEILVNMDKTSAAATTKSPCGKSSQRKNLTGAPRHVRDLTADIHANIQQWNNLHLHGLSILKLVTQVTQGDQYSDKLQDLCDGLEETCFQLDNIVNTLRLIAKQVKITTSMHTGSEKLFKTWSISAFGEIAECIWKAYSKEARVKRSVLENVAHGCSESLGMLHLATWVHQPSLPVNFSIPLESVLTETGHR